MPPKKATPEQYKLLVDMFAESKCLRWGKGTPGEKKEAWEAISAAVNTLGVEKSSDGWKKAFIEMKSHIKSKIRASNQLNPTENRCAEVTGLFISCSGISGVQEMGMPPVVDAIDTQEPEEGPQDESVEINPPDGNELLMNPNACEVVEEEFEEVETASKKKRKTTQVLLNEHVVSTNRGLQNIALAIQSVADAINNIAFVLGGTTDEEYEEQ
ncbi:uncharacterized protein LOC116175003 [Photinus pyralis]|uniref:uncharacterized protein LOC116175003 n=1 Tax=Photinus pyralis TaxID=7054 RepID=UPI0012676FCB|nr:uncharacterized protein LOC116160237 isoform X2 [Photinus pyralis]XP_031348902.1 uncharacterized protein LOC116175003 [Photinus pyralis]